MLVELLRAEGFQRGYRRRTTRRNISSCHLPEGLIVQPEKNAINKEHPETLQRLCRLKAVWCLPSEETKH